VSGVPQAMALHLLYGGTFDPIHCGHLAVARVALESTRADHLDFVPAADPPHRAAPGAAFADRIDLIAAALAGEPPLPHGEWGIDAREGRRPGPSFTVDTLRAWRLERAAHRAHPAMPDALDAATARLHPPLGFVLGADAFLGLPTWRDWRTLFDLAHLVVALRPGSDLGALPGALAAVVERRWTSDPAHLHAAPAGRVFRLDLPLRPESATAVRHGLQGRGSAGAQRQDHATAPQVTAGLPPAVAALIAARGLYRRRCGN